MANSEVRTSGTVRFSGGPLDGVREVPPPGFADPLDTIDVDGSPVRYRLTADRFYELDTTSEPAASIDPAGN